ncbi:hypothetical protein IKF28_00605 [Candidatus Saccharibacteria bacterium]|nr:hypothetical protein [Candidatus Saccharibacteria bacterium]MBR3121932.1 hypothetical protein [Candidatus Saccharibacteria bacterium]
MGIIVNKENSQDELSRRISADLKDRAVEADDVNDPDLAEDAEYLKDLKKTGKFSWAWFILIVLAILSIVSIIFF